MRGLFSLVKKKKESELTEKEILLLIYKRLYWALLWLFLIDVGVSNLIPD